MGLFEGKTPSERNKMIAAGILGVVSLVALYMAFGRGFFGGSTTTATVKASPTPSPKSSTSTASNSNQFRLPTPDENALNVVVPVVYNPGNTTYGAPDPGRNIFAFYEPPPPTPYQTPSPTPPPPPPSPSPIPTPPFLITAISPASIYAGSKGGFKLDVYGERFTPDSRIFFNQTEMPTQFTNAQSLATTVSEKMVAQEGPKQVIVQTPDGRSYSAPFNLSVLAPPKPTSLSYIGMIGRKRYNNDTAYFMETGKTVPIGARLNDILGGRFRLIDISAAEVVFEDTTLGFKHRIAMTTSPSGPATGSPPAGGFIPYNPNGNPQIPNMGNPRMPPQPQSQRPDQRRPPTSKDDVDDNDNPNQ